jgi:50S ribosomal protein L16 3-hydroxylase
MYRINYPNGLEHQGFLRNFWQRRPLLLPNALPGYRCPLQPEELAGLACEPEVESRLVLEQGASGPWELRQGPFSEADFAALPRSHWTLLVQDADKWLPELAQVLEYFRFLPDWRVDDLMVSYAADGGSVGPHFDEYDVFLYQARGRRRWQIHTRPVDEADCVPGLDLRILPEFVPEQEWLLEPGDMLYLPPRVAHWGVALGDDCMTCSIGFRAPAWRELVGAWSDFLLAEQVPDRRYRDPPLEAQTASAEITPTAIADLRRRLNELLEPGPDALERWFGSFVTEPKEAFQVAPPEAPIDCRQLIERFRQRSVLQRHPFARLAFLQGAGGDAYLFANGETFRLRGSHPAFLRALTQQRQLHFEYLVEHLQRPACAELLCRLYNAGYLEFDDD